MQNKKQLITNLISYLLVAVMTTALLGHVTKQYIHTLKDRVNTAAEEVAQGQAYCYVVPYLIDQKPEQLADGSNTVYMPAQYFSPFPALIRKLTLDKDIAKWEKRGDRITPMHFGIITQGLSYQWSFKKSKFVLSNSFNHYGDFTKTQNLPPECLAYSTADTDLLEYGYKRDGDRLISLQTEISNQLVIKDINFDALEIIDYHLIKDDKNVYLFGEVIPDADPATFEVVDNSVKNHSFLNKDANHMYYNYDIIQGADPNDFEYTPETKTLKIKDATFILGGNFIYPEVTEQN